MIHWFKRKPELLKVESRALSTDSNYREIFQCCDNVFLSHGYITVRLDKVYEHPVLIIYPDATPQQLPLIFPLTEELDERTLNLIASMSVKSLVDHIQTHIAWYFKLRHQGGNGALCVVEWDNLDEGAQYYGITTILKRIRDWYAGHVTGKYPPDSQETEFTAHYRDVDFSVTFLYPAEFLNDQLISGYFYAANMRSFGINAIYAGGLFDGVRKSGLISENSAYLFYEGVHPELKTSLDFQTKDDLVNKLVDEGKLIYGCWFQVDSPLLPFKSFSDLVTIIGNGNFEAGVMRFVSENANFFERQAPQKIIIGIQYPNARGVFEFQVFRVHKKDLPPQMLLKGDPQDRMLSILNTYERVEALPSEKFTKESYHMRNSSRADQKVLEHKFVHVLGTGALGGDIADTLGKAGVGFLELLDRQLMAAANPVRHVAGLEYVGVRKVDAVADIIKNHNPFVRVRGQLLDLYYPDLLMHFPKDSWSVSTVADDNLEAFLNEEAISANHTMFYARALRGGKVGRIFRVVPGKDACFHCLALYQQENKEFITIPPDPEHPTLFNECNNPVRPASAADLKIISAIASRIVLDQLQASELSEQNHWIWSTEVIESTPINEKNKLYEQTIKPHAACPYCNHDSKIAVSIGADTLAGMQKLVAEKKGVETGGVLAGVRDLQGNIKITHASGPGPKAIHKETQFHKDIEFCQKFLDELISLSGGDIVYVGEWHSHPSSDNRPSGIDLMSLSQIANQKEYLTMNPTMIIFSSDGEPSCTAHPAGKLHYRIDLEIVKETKTKAHV